jgi:Flp pilus assembly protein TadG
MRRRARHRARGFALVFVAGSLGVLLLLGALVVDLGMGFLTRARLGKAVDAAALAAVKLMPTAPGLSRAAR